MASQALTVTDWKAAFRRSLRRAGQIAGAAVLTLGTLFLALSLASYAQTDPSQSTAAADTDIANWMGASGAWAAERALYWFGLTAVLLLPLLYISARRLWRGIETDSSADEGRWWRPFAMLLAAMVLLATVLALIFEGSANGLPPGSGALRACWVRAGSRRWRAGSPRAHRAGSSR